MLGRLFARRYLFSRNARSVINIISGVSVAAVAVPVAAMVMLLSVFNGFESLVKQMCSAYDADITVSPARGTTFATEEMQRRGIEAVEGVEAVSYAVEQGALLEYRGRRTAAEVRGADENYAAVLPAAGTVRSGEFRLQLGEDIDETVLGQGLAYALGVHSFVADDVKFYALRSGSVPMLLPTVGYASMALPVAGTFAIDARTDGAAAIASLRAAQRLFGYEGRATTLLVKVAEGGDPQRVKSGIERAAGSGFKVETRDERNATFYAIMRYEKWGIFFISLLVLVVASFSIVGSLAMLIIDKRDDMETLHALGADGGLLRRIFVTEGMLICGIGGACGLAAGVALSLAQQHFGIITIPAETFLVSAYPVELKAADVLLVGFSFVAVAWAISYATVAAMIRRPSPKESDRGAAL